MVRLSEIKAWQPEALLEIAGTLRGRRDVLTHSGDDFGKALPVDGWQGAAADGAATGHGTLRGRLDTMTASAGHVITGLDRAGDAIPPVQREIAGLESLAQRFAFRIGDDGSLTDLLAGEQLPPDMHPDDRATAQRQLGDGIGRVLRTAGGIDRELAEVFRRAERGDVPTGAQTLAATTPTPPPNGTPQQNADWWAGLTAAERQALIEDPANPVGNLDGIPATDRSAANMHALPGLEQDLQRQIDGAGGDERDALTGKLNALRSLGDTVDSSASLPESQRYYLLGVDQDDAGKAILARGNPDTAAHVATFVPGTSSRLANLTGGTKDNADALYSAAGGSRTGTSVIAWQGYEAPPDLPHAAGSGYADRGKDALDGFQQGLRVTHEGAPSTNTVIGHSYGTTVIGHAARDGDIAADSLVFAGSPGVGVEHASDLHVPADHVYATEAEHDIIRLSNVEILGHDPILGPDPTDSDFGGHPFDAAPGTEGHLGGLSAAAHSEYWKAGNPSLINMGLIINGQQPTAH